MSIPLSTPKLALTAALAACLTFGAAIAAHAGGYSAIAYSVCTGADGYAHGYNSRREAEESALEQCDGDDARVVTWKHNGYVALARGKGRSWGAAGGATLEEAKRKALDACPSRYAHIKRWTYSCD